MLNFLHYNAVLTKYIPDTPHSTPTSAHLPSAAVFAYAARTATEALPSQALHKYQS